MAAWQALSDLFLDTELDEADIAAIARQLRDTGFSLQELERIYEDEVAPACWRNLAVLPGGEWSGFSPAWLAEAIPRERERSTWLGQLSWVHRLQVARWTRETREDWERVKRQLAAGG